MRKELNIRIPTPCHEDWEKMIPNYEGRHCNSCAKTVVDFTSASDETIIKTIEKGSNLCGRFNSNQLNRSLVLERKENNSWLSLAVAALISMMSLHSLEIEAQEKPKMVQSDSVNSNKVKRKLAHSILKQRTIQGTVFDQDSLPIPGANVIIKGMTIGTHTDFDGNFSLRVKNGDVISCSSIGFQSLEKRVTDVSSNNFTLELNEDMLGEIVVVGGYVSADYEYIPTKEEIAEQKRLRKFRRNNYFKFYKRKFKEKKEDRRRKRKRRREKKDQ